VRSVLVRIKVSFLGTLFRAQTVELTRSTYQKLVDDLNPLTSRHLTVEKHHLDVDLIGGPERARAVDIIDIIADSANSRQPDPDELRVEYPEKRLAAA
jgi:hypothetical protein